MGCRVKPKMRRQSGCRGGVAGRRSGVLKAAAERPRSLIAAGARRMPAPAPIARPLAPRRSRGLRGRFPAPADPGLAALTVMLAVLARGETVIYADSGSPGPEIAAVLQLAAQLGAVPELHDDRWHINGLGPLGLLAPEAPLDFTGAERSLPLALGLLAPYEFASRFDATGNPALPPGLLAALRGLGAEIDEQQTGRLPLTLKGPRSGAPFAWRAESGEAAVEAMLLAAMGLPGISSIGGVQRRPEQALGLMRHFGAAIAESTGADGMTLAIGGLPALGARTLTIPGDPELAAFALLAALIVPDSDLVVENVLVDTARAGTLTALLEMGADIETLDRRNMAGLEIADFRARHSALLGVAVEAAGLSRAGIALLAVAGAVAAGETRIPRCGIAGEAELHRRLAATLSLNGATATADADGLTVGRPRGGRRLGGGTIEAGRDAQLAAGLLVLGLAAAEPLALADGTALAATYPGLVGGLEALGAEFSRGSAR